ncbi:hypothetical protein JCM14720_17570 [Calditerricola yamamurae]
MNRLIGARIKRGAKRYRIESHVAGQLREHVEITDIFPFLEVSGENPVMVSVALAVLLGEVVPLEGQMGMGHGRDGRENHPHAQPLG